ncbi:MAG: inositol monophosphatase [Rhodospirillales bacterium]|jgi:fructose-1,6-bisphosphatase/inositol monophosphatase family enzyme|nr:inositol monophosphatase [Rhodospirillales bacterium]
MLTFHREVMRLMAEVAAREIVPRFGKLAAGDVRDKGNPWDLVTIADERAEAFLSAELLDLVPGSAVVGEEAFAADASVITALGGAAPVWLIDPVDGTNNFVHGQPCFAVVIAYCEHGATRAGWILDPLSEVIIWAESGAGAFRTTRGAQEPVSLSAHRSITEMTGAVPFRVKERLTRRSRAGDAGLPRQFRRLGSAGHEYMELAAERLDFALYRRLKPWDHAAGVLIHGEAGGFGRLRGGAAPYRPLPQISEASLLLAPSAVAWAELDGILD